MHAFQSFLVLVLSTVAMEAVAWFSHRYVMHSWGWGWHASHHARGHAVFERNDLFAIVFAGVAIALIWYGTSGLWPLQWVGAGMTLYGALYFVVHDGMVHRRWPLRYVPRKGYMRRLYQAHLLHHACTAKDGATAFGFLLAPSEKRLRRALADWKRDAA